MRAELIRQVGQAPQPRARAPWCIPLMVRCDCLRRHKGSIRGNQHQVARSSLRFAHAQRPAFLIGQHRVRAASRWTWVNSTRTSCFVENCDASAELVESVENASRPSASRWKQLFALRRTQQSVLASGSALEMRCFEISSIGAARSRSFPHFPHVCLAALSCFWSGFFC